MASRRRKCSNVPLAPLTRQTLEMSLQQSLCNGHEDVLRQWLGGDETDGEEQTDGGEEREGERGSESLRNTNINAYDSFGLTSMHYAARLNRYKMMSNLVKKNADPEVRTSEGLTPLHYAARYTPLHTIGEGVVWTRPVQTREGEEEEVDTASVTLYSSNEQILQLLIKKCKVDINVCDEDKDTPLHLACMRGNLVAVGILTSATRVNVDAQNEKGDTPLHFACLNGDPEIVEALLKKEADCLIKNKEKQLAIHLACAEGHVDIVKLILEKHSDKIGEMMNTCDQECNTPLHFACESGSVEIVKLLLLNGADPNACRFHKVTPLHIVAKEGFIDIAKVLLQNKNSEINVNDANLLSPIHYAAQFGRVKMIEFLLSKDADIESQDTDLYTPLLTAAAYGQMEAMKALIKANALIDVVDRTRKTLVFIAAEEDQVHILEALVLGIYEVWGSELVNTTDSIHNTPLHIAAKKGNINSLKVLLQASHLKIDARNEAQRTPLHLAAANGHSNIINALIPYAKDAGKDILKDEDDDGNTALHLACINERFYAAKALILAGADPEDRNARQWTPIDCAAASGKENIVQLLIDAKVEIDPRGINNTTPLQLACKEGHIKVVNKLLENGANVSLRTKGLNALDVAVENGQKDVAMAIVRSKQWESALRNVTYFNQFETEDSTEDDESVATTPSKGRRGATFTTPMRRIIRKMPDVAEVIFNRCCQTNNDKVSTDDPDYKINFMYEFLEDFCVEPQCLRRAKKRAGYMRE